MFGKASGLLPPQLVPPLLAHELEVASVLLDHALVEAWVGADDLVEDLLIEPCTLPVELLELWVRDDSGVDLGL